MKGAMLVALMITLGCGALRPQAAHAQGYTPGNYTAGSGTFGDFSLRSGSDQPAHDNSAYYASNDAYLGWGDTRQTLTTNTQRYQQMLQGPTGRLQTGTALLAPGTVDPQAIGQQSFSLGFPNLPATQYTGSYRNAASGGALPPTATSSVDINTVDNGGYGAATSDSGGGSGGTSGGSASGNGSQMPPDLPPGWAGVMCHGVYAGAIPPGGSVLAFWQGAYGFAGDAAQQAALAQEGQWLIQNGEVGQ